MLAKADRFKTRGGTCSKRSFKHMKNILLLLIYCSFNWYCSDKAAEDSDLIDRPATKDYAIVLPDTNEIKINADFPFGFADLPKYKYPQHWEGDMINYGQLKKPEGKEFEDCGLYFNKINSAKTIKAPKLGEIEPLNIADKNLSNFYFDSLASVSTDICKYRLHNMGPYECYYYVENSKTYSYGVYGNLLLVEPETRNGKVLNLYFGIGGDQHVGHRYFFIDQDSINLYEGSCFDDGCDLIETYTVSIHRDGKITIKHG